jgi:GR25 family glycosyltransferase involved in LPS biosynthesis
MDINNPYTYFDKIYCINLEHRKDRQESSAKIFHDLNIPVEFFYTTKLSQNPILGCFLSHIKCIKKAYDSGANTILIFEDDIIPTKGYDVKIITECIEFMKKNKWEIFKFGFILHNIKDFIFAKKITNNIINFCGYTTHAYCLSRAGMERILYNAYNIIQKSNIIPIDVLYLNIFPKEISFCSIPLQFDQKWCIENNNIPFCYGDSLYRSCQCMFEKYNIWYNISIIYYCRIHLVIFIIFLVIIIFVIKQVLTSINKYTEETNNV